jgi:predicted Ser/Thr protein kinase
MLLESLQALTNLGVAHDDSKLDNYLIVGDRIMVIDFDSSYFMKNGEPQFHAEMDANFATELYWLAHGGTKPKLM